MDSIGVVNRQKIKTWSVRDYVDQKKKDWRTCGMTRKVESRDKVRQSEKRNL